MKRKWNIVKSIAKDIVTSEPFLKTILLLCFVVIAIAIYKLIDSIIIF
jgi:hypothetical protein